MSNTPKQPEKQPLDAATLSAGLKIVRRRRWYLWGVILAYLPTMAIASKLTSSFNEMVPVFITWFFVLLVVAMVTASARCPRCGNYFHMNGMTFLCLRKCLHCQLHLLADRRPYTDF